MSEKTNIANYFGEYVFNDSVMQERLPKKVYKELKRTIEEGKELEASIADVVAHERGVQVVGEARVVALGLELLDSRRVGGGEDEVGLVDERDDGLERMPAQVAVDARHDDLAHGKCPFCVSYGCQEV